MEVQPPPEKCAEIACANEPKPPRVTLTAANRTMCPTSEWLDEESLPKKLLRDDDPPVPPPLDETLLQLHAVRSGPVSADAATPGRFGLAVARRGISA